MLSAPLSAGGCLGSGPGQADVAVTILCGVAGLESCPTQPLHRVLPFQEQPDGVQMGRCGAQLGSFLPFKGLGRGSRCLQPPRAVQCPPLENKESTLVFSTAFPLHHTGSEAAGHTLRSVSTGPSVVGAEGSCPWSAAAF